MKTPEEIWNEMPSEDIINHEIMTVEDAYRIAEAYHAQFTGGMDEVIKEIESNLILNPEHSEHYYYNAALKMSIEIISKIPTYE